MNDIPTNATPTDPTPSPEAAFLVLPPGRMAWMGALAAAAVVALMAVAVIPTHPVLAAALGAIAVLATGITLVALAPPWQPLRLTQSGLSFATTLKRFELRWSDVRAFGMAHVGGMQLVCVTYAKPDAARARFGLFDWFLPSHYGMTAEGLARTLEHTRARLGAD